ncbi:glycoside hydrolase family 3 protein [Thermothelomyces thermophilus ATCC 42464]|uniref:beta-glucosidase n=1 Tax=Thermothelomyces thermophilus (strain ATCC 42464 / BCRC 31852 / DSM 1799) TaxID=573729 RepID=G2QMR6_THET4|nr:glycoside hydrolase family 3 protein [Thermothelomyces thermophilus ATCC 42464]AEO61246.1 glycoside hydrolase family 3 protein [Thermothelomyces thermophilus ATCC 42464]
MARDGSHQGLLRDSKRSPQRPKDDAGHDSDSDIEAIEYLDRNAPRSPKSDYGPSFPAANKARQSWILRCLGRRSRCCIGFLAGFIGLWILLSAGGAFVYKKYQEEPPYGQSPPWYPAPKGGIAKTWAESYEKAAKMVSKMTLAEKVNVTTGTGWQMGLAVGTNGPAVHVGFPQLQLQDGPLGIRFADNITAFPASITVGATWNRQLMYARGRAHGIEARQKGINVLLGPCVGPLGRMPAGGRNWEGFGADPYLQGVAGAETVKGIQSEGVMATIKHFVGNEQEHFRQPWEWGLPHALSANIDDRTLHELYVWPFADAVKAGVASVMCSYNMVNNSYACGNSKLLNGILKDEMGFQGFVMSDWLAQRSGVASALAGLDMTMPGDGAKWASGESFWGPELSRAVLNGSVPVDRLNDMVTRIVAAWYQLGQDDETKFPRQPPNFSSWTDDRTGVLAPGSPSPQEKVVVNQFVDVKANHSVIAREVAVQGTVLLKNEGLLPISRTGLDEAELEARRGAAARATGRRRTGKFSVGVFGDDAGPGKGPNYCKDRACNQGTLASGWGSGAVEFPYLVSPIDALRKEFDSSKVELHEHLTDKPSFAGKDAAVLEDLELCIVFVNADAGEGFVRWEDVKGDRPNLNLQKGGDDLIVNVASKCGSGSGDVIVVVHAVGPVLMEKWIELPNIKAVLFANLPGQESGNALADVLFGKANPSGHLPFTIGKSPEDYGPGGKVMYLPNGVVPQQDFSEGLYVDYRYFDKKDIEPRFEFGFGLSYTTFNLSNLRVTSHKNKSALPAARPSPAAQPPSYPTAIPPKDEAMFPPGFRALEKYIYPYLESVDDIEVGDYPYPDGYDTEQPLSGAGGDEGGNPDLWATYVTVSADVKNDGPVAGAVVPQLYLEYPAKEGVDFPVRVLRGFDKFYLEPGETHAARFNLTRRDLSYWDVVEQNWVMVTEGEYKFRVGFSSRDLPLTGTW